jgi:SAM-dependent methyltransferase
MTYDPKAYWEERLRRDFSLGGVGHIGFSERYNRWLYRRKRRCLERALRGVHLRDKRVLDVGCGTGFFVEWYLAKGCKVTGIDITEISVKRLQETLLGEFYTRDITVADYPRAETKFDIVNIWDVIYHVVDNDAYDRALDNIASDLGAGGLLLLTDFLGAAADTRLAPHVVGRCLETYKTKLPGRGFQLVEVRPLYKFLTKSRFRYFDNHLGAVYYFADSLVRNIPTDAVSLSVWRRSAGGQVP